MQEDRRVLIAGGGPVGLFCALLLGRHGIPVRVFDANPELQDDPRAATTHPATLEVLDEAGLVEDLIAAGLVAPIFQFWDRPTNTKVAEFDHVLLKDDTKFPFVVQTEQFKTSRIIMQRLLALPNVEVLFDHAVTHVTQDAGSVTVTVESHGKTSTHKGAYLIGADGGRSTVRKQCEIAFEGFTLLTGPDPEAWRGFKAPPGAPLRRLVAGTDFVTSAGDWAGAMGLSRDGALLVRPDGHILDVAVTGAPAELARLSARLKATLAPALEGVA